MRDQEPRTRHATNRYNPGNTFMRHAIHKIICWYLRRCAGAFHCYNYGDTGRYVVLMDEGQYARYAKLARTQNESR